MIPADNTERELLRPFASSAKRYRANGWLGTLPLPPRSKEPPPDGFTGHGKPYPSDVDVRRWRKGNADGNICLRLYEVPREQLNADMPFAYSGNNVDGWALLGIDVDDYADKHGAAQLRDLEAQLGPLPATVVSSARWSEAPLSGIRLFLVPKGYRYKGKAAKHIDVIHAGHRYAVVWPSVHPSGSLYEFRYGAPGSDTALEVYDDTGVPPVTDVALLPEPWFAHLLSDVSDHADAQSDMKFGELEDWAEAILHGCTGDPCRLIADDLAKYVDALDESDQHHPLNTVIWRLTQNGLEGHRGWYTTVRAYIDHWTEVSRGKRHPDEMQAEVMRSIDGALRKAKATFDERSAYVPDDTCDAKTRAEAGEFDCDAWHDRLHASGGEQDELAHEVERAYRRRKADRLARQRLALDDWSEPEDEGDLGHQIANPDPDEGELVHGLIRSRGIVLINAQHKTGKTTLASVNLPKALVTRQPFLRKFGVEFGDHEHVGIWNLEVDRQDLVDWLERVGIPPEARGRVHPKCLRGNRSVDFRNPLAVDWTVRWLQERGITVWVIDPLSKLYRGDENSSTEFNEWWSTLEEIMQRAGVRVAILVHHSGHGGEGRARGTSAMMGNPDVLVEYRHGGEHGELPPDNKRYLRAFGRRIDLPSITLDYNPATLELFVDEGGGSREENQEKQLALKLWNALKKSGEPLNQGDLFRSAGRKAQGKNSAKARAAVDYAQAQGWISVEKAGNANMHSIGPNDPYADHRMRFSLRDENEVEK